MRYPIIIEPETDATAWGVLVPDLPGCLSAGDTLEQAMIEAWALMLAKVHEARDAGASFAELEALVCQMEARL